jgi:hypothetical protein
MLNLDGANGHPQTLAGFNPAKWLQITIRRLGRAQDWSGRRGDKNCIPARTQNSEASVVQSMLVVSPVPSSKFLLVFASSPCFRAQSEHMTEFFFFCLVGGGVQLGPLGTAATDWPIVPDDRSLEHSKTVFCLEISSPL